MLLPVLLTVAPVVSIISILSLLLLLYIEIGLRNSIGIRMIDVSDEAKIALQQFLFCYYSYCHFALPFSVPLLRRRRPSPCFVEFTPDVNEREIRRVSSVRVYIAERNVLIAFVRSNQEGRLFYLNRGSS